MNALSPVDVQQKANQPTTRSRETICPHRRAHFILLLLLLFLCSTANLFAQDSQIQIPGLEPVPDLTTDESQIKRAPKQIEVFFAPWDLHIIPKHHLDRDAGFFPESPISFKECIQGKIYDVTSVFERRQGTVFRSGDVCCFSPESRLLIVAASEEDMKQITWVIHNQLQQRPILSLRGEVVVKDSRKQRDDRFLAGKWNLISASGMRATVSGGNEIRSGILNYKWEFEPIVNEVGNTLNYNMAVNVRLDNGTPKATEYNATTSGTLTFGKRHSMLIGTTADGEEIHLRFTATLKSPRLPEALETPEKKQQLIECIRRQLAK